MKKVESSINIVIGQLEGVKRMITAKQECLDILIQLKAIKSGINLITNKLIEEKALDCLIGGKKVDKQKIKKLMEELIKNN